MPSREEAVTDAPASRFAHLHLLFVRVWAQVPAILAFALLAVQIGIPWTTKHFTTQDGPSHLYTGVVLRDILLHPNGPRAAVYMPQPDVVPNWTSAVLLGIASSVVGAGHAEQLLASFCILAGFFAFEYASRALYPGAASWSPMANFLLQNWFLWIGFYNFYLGIVLCPFVIGYYIRHHRTLTARKVVALALWLLILFFTHIIAAALAGMALVVISVWVHLADPGLRSNGLESGGRRRVARHFGLVTAALIPILILAALFATGSSQGVKFQPDIIRAWNEFPMNAFMVGPGRAGREDLLWPAVFFFIVIAASSMKREEWRSPRGGILAATLVIAALFFLMPDDGLGGQEVKKRFAWSLFVFGSLLAGSVTRLRFLRVPISCYLACFLAGSLMTSLRVSNAIGRAVDLYVASMDVIPANSNFVRLYYPLPGVAPHFGFEEVPFTPLYHTDAYAAATRKLIDLSDYQAASNLFAVVFDPGVDAPHRSALWNLENPANGNADKLSWLRETLPFPIDYVVVVGDDTSREAQATDMPQTLAALNASMYLMPNPRPDSFVRVYRRQGKR